MIWLLGPGCLLVAYPDLREAVGDPDRAVDTAGARDTLPTSASTGDSEAPAEGCGGAPLALTGEGTLTTSVLAASEDLLAPTCASSDETTAEALYRWTAPRTGTFALSVSRPTPLVLALYEEGPEVCEELACAATAAGGTTATLARAFDVDEEVLIAVEGVPTSEDFELSAALVPCPADGTIEVVGKPPWTVAGTLEGALDASKSTCVEGGVERSYLFTAPEAGGYLFSAPSNTPNAFLDVVIRDGTCGEELVCRESSLPDNPDAAAAVALAKGQTVSIIVEQATKLLATSFEVHVDRVPDDQCPSVGTVLGDVVFEQKNVGFTQGGAPGGWTPCLTTGSSAELVPVSYDKPTTWSTSFWTNKVDFTLSVYQAAGCLGPAVETCIPSTDGPLGRTASWSLSGNGDFIFVIEMDTDSVFSNVPFNVAGAHPIQ